MSVSDRFFSFLTDGLFFLKNVAGPGMTNREMQVYYGIAPLYGVTRPDPLSWFDQLGQSNFKYVLIFIPIIVIFVLLAVIILGITRLLKKSAKTRPLQKK